MYAVDTLISNITENGFVEFHHTELFSDGTPMYDDVNYRYFKDGNFIIIVSPTWGSVVLEREKGGILLASTTSEFYIMESYANGITVGIGTSTTLTLGV